MLIIIQQSHLKKKKKNEPDVQVRFLQPKCPDLHEPLSPQHLKRFRVMHMQRLFPKVTVSGSRTLVPADASSSLSRSINWTSKASDQKVKLSVDPAAACTLTEELVLNREKNCHFFSLTLLRVDRRSSFFMIACIWWETSAVNERSKRPNQTRCIHHSFLSSGLSPALPQWINYSTECMHLWPDIAF